MTGSLVILTGAGISAESGLGTFRDTDGLWAKFDWQALATPEAFEAQPDRVHDFYNARRANLADAKPHAAHEALARLEQDWLARGGEFLLVTQNVDDLHEQAGSERLVHMHGELKKMRCMGCHSVMEAPLALGTDTACPRCQQPGFLRPHVVWFGEMPFEMKRIYSRLECCRLFISIGTSGNVYPAASFVQQVRRRSGAHTAELNMEPSEGATLFAEAQYGLATVLVPAYVKKILNGRW